MTMQTIRTCSGSLFHPLRSKSRTNSQMIRSLSARTIINEILKDEGAFRKNTSLRKSALDVDQILNLLRSYDSETPAELNDLLRAVPNWTHALSGELKEPKILDTLGEKNTSSKRCTELFKGRGLLQQDKEMTVVSGERSYILAGDLVRLEQALMKYTLSFLRQRGFELVSVPDIFKPEQVSVCGMETFGKRNQIYKISLNGATGKHCLSGTSEIALANLHTGKSILPPALPKKLCAVSRCFREEVSSIKDEKGLYRVHQFNKVEMFGITDGCVDESQKLQNDFVEIQKELFSSLGLHYQILEMPPSELGNSAYRKVDIECWMNGHDFFGEISSTSDCTNYQSSRLDIMSNGRLVHTVNGTACAIPRMLIALCETHTLPKNVFAVPKVLRPFMKSDTLSNQQSIRQCKKLSFYFFENDPI